MALRGAQLFFRTLLRGASHHSSTFYFVYRPSGPLQHVPAPLSGTSCRSKYFPTRRHIFRHRSTALRTSLRRSEFFPTLLLGASHCSNICPIGSVILRAALIFSHTSPNLPPGAAQLKNHSECIVHRSPRRCHPCTRYV